ncbi:hypothetical protein TGMAS_416340 [Toxoplasma gondii MAS]|uniref:Uncharacterized protein n=1 Tax=Toxoplasma gondii MAS TaxID=943118 RepID=A0A086PXN1_TOXGO|nr:hypothetical protein TGMAS_416340 [Toxoplasma gondii MAS]
MWTPEAENAWAAKSRSAFADLRSFSHPTIPRGFPRFSPSLRRSVLRLQPVRCRPQSSSSAPCSFRGGSRPSPSELCEETARRQERESRTRSIFSDWRLTLENFSNFHRHLSPRSSCHEPQTSFRRTTRLYTENYIKGRRSPQRGQ